MQEKLNEGKGNQGVQNRSFNSNNADSGGDLGDLPEEIDQVEGSIGSVNRRKQYKDAADAAQEAFLSAAHAAAAARAAVELSRSSPRAPDDEPHSQRKQAFGLHDNVKSGLGKGGSFGVTDNNVLGHDRMNPLDTDSLDSEDEDDKEEAGHLEVKHTKQVGPRKNSSVVSYRVSEKGEKLPQEVIFDESESDDDEVKNEKLDLNGAGNPWGEGKTTLPYASQKQMHSGSSAGLAVKSPPRLNLDKPISVRKRR